MKTDHQKALVPLTAEQIQRITDLKAALKRPRARVLQGLVQAGLQATEGDLAALEAAIRK